MKNETSKASEGQQFADGGTETADRTPVDIKVGVGDSVRIRGTVVDIAPDAITIEIDDGLENNVHRVTINSNQAAHALK
jgi:hypothetical protein